MEGSVKYKGSKQERGEMCYIMQEDCLEPLFTVHEMMTKSANLKLGSGVSEKTMQLLVSTRRCTRQLLYLNHLFTYFTYSNPRPHRRPVDTDRKLYCYSTVNKNPIFDTVLAQNQKQITKTYSPPNRQPCPIYTHTTRTTDIL